ncbi:MAG: D-alanine--D-alanine ligase [Myxococcota bacterium]|nr:D-alanine--D-alanine ligase [Myxococcota bacterium]
MHITILHNRDHDLLQEDPGREAREDVVKVAAALADALEHGGTTAEPLAVQGAQLDFLTTLQRRRPQLVINLCESLNADARGEMAIPCLLDLLGIPFTGSGALSLGLALHKNKAKEILRARGVSSPEFAVIERVEDLARVELPFPLIVKPAREDASIGIDFDSVVHDRASLARAVLHVMQTFSQPALVERYIEGREIYVPLLGNRPRTHLPLTEISFGEAFIGKPHIVSYQAKWEPDSPQYKDSRSLRCEIDPVTEARLVKTATAAFDALDCRDYGRVDLRLSKDGEPFVIDINPNCDLHPDAGFAKAARAAGMDYRALASRLVEIALERTHGIGHPLRQSTAPSAAGRAARPH